MLKVAIFIAALLFGAPALAQNITCFTASPADSSNKCASTAFVQGAVSTTAAPHVPTNAVLAASATSKYPTGVWRDDYAANAGAGPLWFTPLTGTCAANSLVNDGGNCVDAAGGNSFKSHYINVVNVAQFGTDLSGATNSLSTLQAAKNVAVAAGGSFGLFFPCGSYLISGGTLEISGAGSISAYAPTTNCVKILNGNTNIPAIRFGDGTNANFGAGIHNFIFAGAAGTVGVSGQTGLSFVKQNQSHLSNIKTTNIPSALYDGMIVSSLSQMTATNIEAVGATNNGVNILGVGDLYLSSSRADGNTSNGWYISGSQGLYFSDVSGYNNDANAFNINGSIGLNKNFLFSNVVGDTSGGANWYISNLSNASFANCWGNTQQDTAVNTSAAGFYLTSSSVHNLYFSQCKANFNNGFGFNLFDPTGAAGTNSPYDIFITQTQIGTTANGNGQSGSGYGIAANGTATFSLLGGQLQGNASGTISLSDAASYQAIGTSGVLNRGPTSQTPASTVTAATYIVGANDSVLIFNGGASITVTLPSASANPGRTLVFKNIAAFAVVSASSNVVPLAGGAAGTAILAATAGSFATLQSDGTNWQIMAGG
jgi:hypothetical protein